VKIDRVRANNRKKAFEVTIAGDEFAFPYSECDVVPSAADPIERVYIDPELAHEGFTYVLRSGAEDAVLGDHVLWFHQEPDFVRGVLLYGLTLEAQKRVAESRVSRNEILRRTGTSASQLVRLLDQRNTTKSIDKMVELLVALGCSVEMKVKSA
jgi:hypothetical protein